MLGEEPAAELDILDDGNAWTYWSRSDAHTMALNIGSNPRSREGLARVIEVWVRHLLDLEVRVEPVAAIEDRDWRWFVGLDAEATGDRQRPVGGDAVDEAAQARVLALFRLTFADSAASIPASPGIRSIVSSP